MTDHKHSTLSTIDRVKTSLLYWFTLVLIRNFRFLIRIAILIINLVTYFFTENRVHKRHLNICFAGLKITVKILLEQNICFFRCPSRYAKLWRCVDVKQSTKTFFFDLQYCQYWYLIIAALFFASETEMQSTLALVYSVIITIERQLSLSETLSPFSFSGVG